MLLSRLTLLTSLALIPSSYAASTNKNGDGSCSVDNTQLQVGTYQLNTDCSDDKFCNKTSNHCDPKGCRTDEFPLGYAKGDKLPKKCSVGEFCPDEGDDCLPWLKVGSACQLNRDDECEGPPNFAELRDPAGFRNHNGSVCLNFQCQWANISAGVPCIVEQMPYIAYGANSQEFIYVSSRDNCRLGLYCDAHDKVCLQQKDFGAACTADKECLSNNCLENLTCGQEPQAPTHFASWVYIVVGVGILLGMFGTLGCLYMLHRRTREQEREKRIQYWREQNAFRQNILNMRDAAKTSLLSLSMQGNDTPRSTIYGGREHNHTGSEDSSIPMLRRNSDQDNMGGWGQRQPSARRQPSGRRI